MLIVACLCVLIDWLLFTDWLIDWLIDCWLNDEYLYEAKNIKCQLTPIKNLIGNWLNLFPKILINLNNII